jgi:PiT family inorganic phosphate transporter
MTIVLLLLAVLVLAYANGANDNFKGVATLYGSGTLSYRSSIALATTLTLGSDRTCAERDQGSGAGISAGPLLDALHCASAAAVSFARGLNDTPKMVALLLATRLLAPERGLLVVGVAIAFGGLLSARRVAETMSHRITAMNPGQAFTGNLTTALLVLFASRFGLPVSTTHVSCGSLVGIGLITRQARWSTIGQILLAWVTTVPAAAILAALVAFAQH